MSDQVMPNVPTAWGESEGARHFDEEYTKVAKRRHTQGGESGPDSNDSDDQSSQPLAFTDADFSIHMLAVARATDTSSPNPLWLVAAFCTNFAKSDLEWAHA